MNGKTKRLALLGLLLVIHGIVSGVALARVGFLGIFELAVANWGAGQVTSDLAVALVLINTWILVDARKQGLPGWLFVAASLAIGSFGSLGYLVVRTVRRVGDPANASATLEHKAARAA